MSFPMKRHLVIVASVALAVASGVMGRRYLGSEVGSVKVSRPSARLVSGAAEVDDSSVPGGGAVREDVAQRDADGGDVAKEEWLTNGDSRQADATFRAWLGAYLLGEPAERALMEKRGKELARERQVWMADLMRRDADGAVAAALSRADRAALPAGVAVHVEKFVSARGDYAVTDGIPQKGRKGTFARMEVRLPGEGGNAPVVYDARPVKALAGGLTRLNVPLAGLVLGQQMVVQREVLMSVRCNRGCGHY
jgi:hypothetical protein